MYKIIPITKDFFKVIKENIEYKVDLAKKTCTCPDFKYKSKKIKKKYRCKHLKMTHSQNKSH